MLCYFVVNLGREITREELWREVWGWQATDLNTIAEQVCIQGIQRKLKEFGLEKMLERKPEHRYILHDFPADDFGEISGADDPPQFLTEWQQAAWPAVVADGTEKESEAAD